MDHQQICFVTWCHFTAMTFPTLVVLNPRYGKMKYQFMFGRRCLALCFKLNLTLSLPCHPLSESPYSKQYSSFKIYEKSCVVLITYSTTWGLTHQRLNAFDSFLVIADNTSLEWAGTIKDLGVISNKSVLDKAWLLYGEKYLLSIIIYASHLKDPVKINDWMNEFNKIDRHYLLAHNPG